MRFFDGNGAGLTLSAPVDSQSGGPAIPRQPAHRTNPQAEPAPAAFLESCRATGAAGLRSRAFVLPDALTPAVNRPVVAIRAGKRAVSHSHSRIRFAIAHGLIARCKPNRGLAASGRSRCRRVTHNNSSHRNDKFHHGSSRRTKTELEGIGWFEAYPKTEQDQSFRDER